MAIRVPGYDTLCQQLRTRFDARISAHSPASPPHPDTDVLLVPYNFRRSMRQTAGRLDEAVGHQLALYPAGERPQRVIVVAHSTGGLVARYWIGQLGGAR
ncbi:esterase/lipase family protein [Cryptosporangium sp. NPDC051539]|uniref:esterase/lipase family protein n=1 Tax=Cryptosporangium sp. NPDC051539 TaxID=3363962 RepID=UPI0037AE6B53